MGYDGKGQTLINKSTNLKLAWKESGASPKTNGAMVTIKWQTRDLINI